MSNKPIPGFTAEMRDACANAVRGILDESGNYRHEIHDGSNDACWEAGGMHDVGRIGAAKAIRAMPVAPMFPEPMRETPEYGQEIWIVNLSRLSFCEKWAWAGGTYNMRDFHKGLCHASQEAAEAHGGYLVSLSAKTEDAP